MISNSSASNLSLSPNASNDVRTRAKSVSKKHTKELIKKETKQVVSKKLSTILTDLGLQKPIPVKINHTNSSSFSKTVSVYVANSNNCIYLAPASSVSFTYEDVENGGMPQNASGRDDIAGDVPENLSVSVHNDEITPERNSRNLPAELKDKIDMRHSSNYLCTKIDSDTPIPHTFGVVIELHKDAAINAVEFEFASLCNILWPTGDPYNKTYNKERFKIGKLSWMRNLNNADFYVNSSNSSDFKSKKIDPDDLARRTRYYKLKDIKGSTKRKQSQSLDSDSITDSSSASNNDSFSEDGPQMFRAGTYVFVLPILLPEHIPPTITSINGSLNHLLTVSIHKNSEKLNRKLNVQGSFGLPMVRTPPSLANSIADKPIYVNRVWNDALHYIITFPRKYVALGSEHSINVKIVPLVKDVIIKRIKFNVLERITYTSHDMSKEYDFDGEDPYYLRPSLADNKPRERVVSVCELKTKNKQHSGYTEPYKEEIIKCPDNNLLFSCYEPDSNTAIQDNDFENLRVDIAPEPENTMIACPLDINVGLPFLTTRNDKIIQALNNEEELKHLPNYSDPTSRKASIVSSENLSSAPFPPSSPIIGALSTNLTHSHNEENIQHGFTTVGRALYPDSNFRHIQIYHRLQVCFRISKPDPKDNFRMHHYEVVVDTPLILLSSKCNDDSIQLPRYQEIDVIPEDTTHVTKSNISFRTPNFESDTSAYTRNENGEIKGNGFSIKPWNNANVDDTLPTFEEATSPVSSPITRSFSVSEDALSRVPSISIDNDFPSAEPPAYEPGSELTNLDEFSGPLNIDAVVNNRSTSEALAYSRSSRLRTSLVSSFAPPTISFTNSITGTSDNALSVSPTNTSSIPMVHSDSKLSITGSLNPQKLSNSNSLSSFESVGADPVESVSLDSIQDISSVASGVAADTSSTAVTSNSSSRNTEDKSSVMESLSAESNASSSGPLFVERIGAETSVDANEGVGISEETNKVVDRRIEKDSDPDPFPTTPSEPVGDYSTGIHIAEGPDGLVKKKSSPSQKMYQAVNDSEISLDQGYNRLPNDSETNLSIMSHSSTFDQRLPLLRNTSTESNLPLAKQNTVTTHNKLSTDNLSVITEGKQFQDIYHTY
ncbi:hypothetical protein CANTEDRAFT_126291 [Yamadazyma tenuis ATCC 10573]|uniref:Arrestin C-terminal-like domain-containing protein n=1 Tax=Candida tenuis (strain ATCC 10573 / BCRC 21748 / CBS 615 / JCM 9827 / NBRC 10315 / NRRL Y-1498 / VKM Y-70) TaxID=590646 RepID=G3B8I1_CANTC|nr:uncharacterized protein CANTEDRAFT_126291 [Yamadazyma tenuis ATCC 10573]EGV62401.1 hypothetical protein CANTEDRAFT_126291 [Yamadazyma tenuis ATCC 10573]